MASAQVGERRDFDGQIAEWDGQGWKPVQSEAPPQEYAPTAHQMTVGGPAAMQAPPDESMGPEAYMVAAGAATPFLPAVGGIVGGAVKAATSPTGIGAGRALYGLATGESLPEAAWEGIQTAGLAKLGKTAGGQLVEKALKKVPIPKSLRARLAHTLTRGAKVAKEEAPAVSRPSAPAKVVPIRAEVKAPSLDDVARRVRELDAAKLSRGQIAEQLRSEFAAGQRGIGVSYFRRFTDQLLDAAK